jgi:hypothetical protein
MSRKQAEHLIKTNFYGIADKIKKAKKKGPTRGGTRKFNKRTS